MNIVTQNQSRTLTLFTFALVGGLLTATSSGCSDSGEERLPVVPVKGELTFNGRPAEGAFVVLHPKAGSDPRVVPARGVVGKDGKFEVSTYDAADGATPGEYNVTVEWRKLIKNGKDYAAGPNVLPPKYSQPASSKLEVRVAEEGGVLEPIHLKR